MLNKNSSRFLDMEIQNDIFKKKKKKKKEKKDEDK
jgi:hypothetical protein